MATKTATTTTRKKTTKKATPKKAAPKKAPRTSAGAARAKSAAKAKATKPATTKQAKAAKPKRVSLLDAAATVLASAKVPMTAKAIVEQVTTKGLWTSGKGKTPHATLYAAMIREIAKKEKDARFKKVERGLFTAAGAHHHVAGPRLTIGVDASRPFPPEKKAPLRRAPEQS